MEADLHSVKAVKLVSDVGQFNITPEKHERLQIRLGINTVEIAYKDGSWQIDCNTNVRVNQHATSR